jgi:hypothetical protein
VIPKGLLDATQIEIQSRVEAVGIMNHRRFSTSFVVTVTLLATVIMISPPARADAWTEKDHADFMDGTAFVGTEVVGVGDAASVQIVRTHDDWINMTPERMPSSRDSYGLAYDEVSEVMVLFGGYVFGEGPSNETWEYNFTGNNWTKVQTNGSPSPRSSPGMAYDASDDVIVLFGGYGDGGFLEDTWEYYSSNHTWIQVDANPHPGGMVSCPMVYHTLTTRVIMVGQEQGTMDLQTWKYDPLTDLWTKMNPAVEPPSRSGHALAFDKTAGRVVLFGGAFGMSFLGDTWEYNPFSNEWEDQMVSGPSPRAGAAMEYLPFWEGSVLFGGMSSNGFENDTWVYTSYGSPHWESVFTTTAPTGRRYSEMEYDRRSDMALLFSGGNTTSWFNDTWLYGPNYIPEGRYVSSLFDSMSTGTDWSAIWWNQTIADRPEHTKILVQLAASNHSYGPFSFGGPDGSADTSYELGVGEPVWDGLHGRYIKYLAVLQTLWGLETPELQDITITYDQPPAPPMIVVTHPQHAELEVPVNASISVYFSEQMDTSSVQFDIQPHVDLVANWSLSDTYMMLTHAQDFAESTTYTIEITSAKDIHGYDLAPGPVPNPWNFVTENLFPYIADAIPYYQEHIPVTEEIEIYFSETMNTSTVAWSVSPDPGGWIEAWSMNDSRLVLWHTNPFESCTWHEVEVSYAEDLFGNQLVLGPGQDPIGNPWPFKSYCEAPYITHAEPNHLTQWVPVNTSIVIGFSEAMDPSSFEWTIDPDPGGWSVNWTTAAEVVLDHSVDCEICTTYTVEVTQARDLDGYDLVPGPFDNPWTFMTICNLPFIVETTPADGDIDVASNASIYVVFSERMDVGSVTWEIDPDPGVWEREWHHEALMILTPLQFMYECTEFTFEVLTGRDHVGNDIVPGPVPNPFTFKTVCDHPVILWTEPADGARDVPLDTTVFVMWNEPMNASSFSWETDPVIELEETWGPNEELVTLTHSEDFIGGITYTFFVDGYDQDGRRWRPSAAPNPWRFDTVPADNPYLIYRDPDAGAQNVPLTKNITLEFSKPMNESTVTWTIFPWTDFSASWSNNSTRLVLSHVDPFIECSIPEFGIDGYDWEGLRLAPRKNWWFSAACFRPYVVSTSPAHQQSQVPLDAPVVVEFSETIDEVTLQWSIDPDPGDWMIEWNWNSSVAYFNHSSNFTECLEYEVQMISFEDMEGRPMKPGLVPNPWRFMTQCENPYILTTDPYDAQQDVPIDHPLAVVFNEPMETSTVSWSLDPNYWPPDTILFSVQWFDNDTRAVFTHAVPFHVCESYNFTITTGKDKDNNPLVPGPAPNPFNFTTVCSHPTIIWTSPVDGEMDVAVNRAISIGFSEPLNQSSLAWTINPVVGNWSEIWAPASVTLSHSVDFETCQLYTVTVVYFKSLFEVPGSGLPVIWAFTTVCPEPQIIATYPMDGAVDIPLDATLVVDFDKCMNTTSVNWTIDPDPGGWSESWAANDTRLLLSHANPFQAATSYVVNVTEATDIFGLSLKPGPVPNPWQFTTGSNVSAPGNLQVWRFFPDDVAVAWDAVDGATSYHVYTTTDKFEPWPWSDMTNVPAPATISLFPGHLSDGSDHFYVVRAYSSSLGQESDNSTMGAKVDIAFVHDPARASLYWMSLPYRTIYSTASDITDELTESRVNLLAKWDRDKQEYESYYFARGKWRGRNFVLAPGDGFYLSVVSDFSWAINGTDANESLYLGFSPSPTKTNAHWISMPYTSVYASASVVVADIEGGLGPGNNTKIIEVRKWDPLGARELIFRYDGSGWSGEDFEILAGEGLCLQVVSSFSWSPRLLTPAVE